MSQSSEPERLGYLLKTAQHALRREMDDALRPLGLSVSTYAVLTELHRQPGLTNADLARRAFITPQSMQGLLVALEKAGLIARGSDRDHGRRQPSRLTAEGVEIVGKADEVTNHIEAKLGQAIAPLTVKEVSALFRRLCRAFDPNA